MSGGTEFSSERPKGDAWGIEDAVTRAAKEFLRTGRSPMIPCVVILGVKTVKVSAGDDGPIHTPVAQIKRIDALENPSAIKAVQKLLLKVIEERNHGKGVEMLPFDEQETIRGAFGNVDAAELAQDDAELLEDEGLNDLDRLRRHLVTVHGRLADDVVLMEVADVRAAHHEDHDLGRAAMMPHDEEWWEWRRIVVAEKTAELHADGKTWGDDAAAPEPDAADDLDEMINHLSAVHRFEVADLSGEPLSELRRKHVNDHSLPEPDGFPPHEVGWLGSTPDELDAAEVQAEDDQTAEQGREG